MKKSLNILLGSMLLLTSCGKDFLNTLPSEKPSTDQVSDAGKDDPSVLNGYILGIYATMYSAFSGVPEIEDHDDFGQKGFDVYMDLLSSDMALGSVNYGWYSDVVRYNSTRDYTLKDAEKPWRYYYKIIMAANYAMDAVGGSEIEVPAEDKETRYVIGQAKAMRAYGYFYLANLYSPEYGTGNDKILPIYTNTQQPNQPLSTTKEVYDLIISDLETAVEYLDGYARSGKHKVNKYVAEGLLAYALGARGTQADWQRVATLTEDIVKNGGFPLTTKSQTAAVFNGGPMPVNTDGGFNNIATASWMWGADITLASNLDLVSWWGQIDYFTYSYAAAGDPKVIDKGLFDKIPANDVRKKQFSSGLPINKFYTLKREPMEQRQIETDYIYMRVDEMVLLNAEANAHIGNEPAAIASLKSLLDLRLDNTTYLSSLSGQALKDEIYLQTRIEFWGEGKSYLAMKRNKATVTRGSNHLYLAGQSFKYNSDEMSFPIPQVEIQNNPQID
ncbi:RagB/SusD family nutrient uptake outer membrane protein [Sphingobacterium humi]|uniref:RagB/SusD family nutrient uptake outer membrane protein n=1 Tax=Sphingobacterium humi TaxID=1796905 RepID=A0A6N8KZU5_9SPHI|nr:RagB/SusD family nutrient uptake outer membrane protein [Sphingobacterium humi]MVZ63033.1 RagB/SusD family nutrient uptake outer membrane protein [Sphingobacterium humi]